MTKNKAKSQTLQELKIELLTTRVNLLYDITTVQNEVIGTILKMLKEMTIYAKKK